MTRFLISLFVVGGLLVVSACGFRPVHGTTGESAELRKQLQSIEVVYQSSLINQSIGQSLERLLRPEDKSKLKKYVLSFDSRVSHGALGIQLDQEVTRYKTTVSISYSLVDKASGKLLRQDTLQRQGGYDVVESEYAEHISRTDTESRVAKELSEDIKLDIMAALIKAAERNQH